MVSPAVFGIGLTEMILIGLVILMLFSPRELPGMIKSVAKVYGSIRRTAEEFRAQVMEADELREPIEEIRAAYHGTKQELLGAQDLARRELQRARSEAMKAQQRLAELAREESRRKDPPPAITTPPATPSAALASANASPTAPAADPAASASAAPASSTAPALPATPPPAAPTFAAPPRASSTPVSDAVLAGAAGASAPVSAAALATPAAPVTGGVTSSPPAPRPTRPPIPGAVASSRPFGPSGDDAQGPPNDRSDAA